VLEKPPLGLKPKKYWQRDRYLDICGAISRYYNVGRKIPIEWIEEYNELLDVIKENEKDTVCILGDILPKPSNF